MDRAISSLYIILINFEYILRTWRPSHKQNGLFQKKIRNSPVEDINGKFE